MDLKNVIVSAENPFSYDATSLMEELSENLKTITGDCGKSSFNANDVCNNRSIFIIARNQDGKAVGCGAFRPIDETTAEVKRMYTKEKGLGIGHKILTYLEYQALIMGYKTLCLETRIVNKPAISFYEQNGYKEIPNYGKYKNRLDSVCFEKSLSC